LKIYYPLCYIPKNYEFNIFEIYNTKTNIIFFLIVKNSQLYNCNGRSRSVGPPPAPLNLRYWWPEVAWFGQIVVFQTDYDEIEL